MTGSERTHGAAQARAASAASVRLTNWGSGRPRNHRSSERHDPRDDGQHHEPEDQPPAHDGPPRCCWTPVDLRPSAQRLSGHAREREHVGARALAFDGDFSTAGFVEARRRPVGSRSLNTRNAGPGADAGAGVLRGSGVDRLPMWPFGPFESVKGRPCRLLGRSTSDRGAGVRLRTLRLWPFPWPLSITGYPGRQPVRGMVPSVSSSTRALHAREPHGGQAPCGTSAMTITSPSTVKRTSTGRCSKTPPHGHGPKSEVGGRDVRQLAAPVASVRGTGRVSGSRAAPRRRLTLTGRAGRGASEGSGGLPHTRTQRREH